MIEMLNFIILITLLILVIVILINSKEDGGLGAVMFVICIMLILNIIFTIELRSGANDWMYEVDRLHQHKKELTPHKMDSINERIHLIRYENTSWFFGQYIPDAIDTLSFFEINHEPQLETENE